MINKKINNSLKLSKKTKSSLSINDKKDLKETKSSLSINDKKELKEIFEVAFAAYERCLVEPDFLQTLASKGLTALDWISMVVAKYGNNEIKKYFYDVLKEHMSTSDFYKWFRKSEIEDGLKKAREIMAKTPSAEKYIDISNFIKKFNNNMHYRRWGDDDPTKMPYYNSSMPLFSTELTKLSAKELQDAIECQKLFLEMIDEQERFRQDMIKKFKEARATRFLRDIYDDSKEFMKDYHKYVKDLQNFTEKNSEKKHQMYEEFKNYLNSIKKLNKLIPEIKDPPLPTIVTVPYVNTKIRDPENPQIKLTGEKNNDNGEFTM